MKKALSLTAVFTLVALSGCTTIHFDNGEVIPDPEPVWFEFWADDKEYSKADGIRYGQWYHHSMYQLTELSHPVQTSEICQGLEWNRVSSEVTPLDILAGLFDNALFINASSAALDLWSPWSVEYSCRTPR